MTVALPPNLGEGSTIRFPAGPSAPAYPAGPPPRSRGWRAIAVLALAIAVIAAVLAVAALVLFFRTRSAPRASATNIPAGFSSGDTAAAQQQLCDAYKLVARAVQVDTKGNNVALARIATTNGAVMLDNAPVNPALDAAHRDGARALAAAYLATTAMGNRDVATDAEFHAALDELIAKDGVMKRLCAGL